MNQVEQPNQINGPITESFDDTLPPYMKGLNSQQQEAVNHLEGPLLILAGAGSGKTKTLTTRAAHLLCTGRAWASQILVVTFTNRAAQEMRRRVETMSGIQTATLPWLGTFHSICARILRRHAELAGLKSNFTILDTDDQLRLLKQIIKADGIDDKKWPARRLGGLIDSWKNKCLLPDQLSSADLQKFNGKGAEFYCQYQERLKTLNAVDFGDLIVQVVQIFRKNNDVLAGYSKSFKYILVDEYQDTNTAQYLWLQLLANNHHNICCVGDDDQSIYGWRGAEIENILRFEHSFSGAKIIRLEQNYRSTHHILGAASAIISNNKDRLGKTLWTADSGGDKVRLMACIDPQSEARWIANEIEELTAGSKVPLYEYSNVTVLVRAAFQMREIEERFLAIGLPYRVVGGPRFYERREIRDAIAYFRLTVSKEDDLAFERIVNVPKRGVGEKGQSIIQEYARDEKISLFESTKRLLKANGFKGRAAIGLNQLIDAIERWSKIVVDGKDSLEDIAGQILDESGLTDMWKQENTPESATRLENLKELVRSIREFDNMSGFLEHVSLVYENLQDSEVSKISLMTLHAAKGLEFPVVFLPGWEEDIFPSKRAIEENSRGVEEERRLAYVGITRAGRLCNISFCQSRFHYGEITANHPSRFVEELPSGHVQTLTSPDVFNPYKSLFQDLHSDSQIAQDTDPTGYSSPGFRRLQTNSQKLKSRVLPSVFKASDTKFNVGDRVFNLKFGYGKVVAVSGNKLLIDFEKAGNKRLISTHVNKADGNEG